jgi:hypothetical protein
MAEETQYTAIMKRTGLTTSNKNLDGTGTLGTLITGADPYGTLIKKVYIKAIINTTHGMVRFFITGKGGSTYLLKEVDVFPVTKSAINPAFETSIDLDFSLASGFILKAATQNSESIAVTAESLNWSYYSAAVREDTTQYTANNGRVRISTANSNLDGTGTIGTAYTAGSATAFSGSSIDTITIKGTVTTTPGMVRIFTYNGTSYVLLTEVPIPSVTPDATDQSFEHTIEFKDSFDIPAGWTIGASTEQAQNFDIMVEGKDWNYVS